MEVIGQLHAWPLYPEGKSPWYPLDTRLGGTQNRSGGSVVGFYKDGNEPSGSIKTENFLTS
jgi:hypothetical protein